MSTVAGTSRCCALRPQRHEYPSVLQIRTMISRLSLSGSHYPRIPGTSSTFRPGNMPGSDVLSPKFVPPPPEPLLSEAHL